MTERTQKLSVENTPPTGRTDDGVGFAAADRLVGRHV